MDCKTARMLLEFARPQALELEPRDANDLAGHFEQCPDCSAAAHAERRLDDCIGRAMRRVEVPETLRQNLLTRLHAERADWYRQRLGTVVRYCAAAAALLLIGLGLYKAWRPGPTKIDVVRILEDERGFRVTSSPEKVQEWLQELKVDTPVPTEFRYVYLAMPPSIAKLQGRDVPVLYFSDNTRSNTNARVYLLSAKDHFDLKSLPSRFNPADGYDYRVEVVPINQDTVCLVCFTGENWKNWLRMPEAATRDGAAE